MSTLRNRLPALSRANVALALSIVACIWAFQIPHLAGAAIGKITGLQIAQNTITSGNIKNGAVSASDMGKNSVTSDKLKNGSVSAADLKKASVGAEQMAPAAVGAAQMKAGAIGEAQLAAQAVSSDKIKDASIGNADLKAGTLTDEKFAAGELPGVVTPLKSGQSVRGVFAMQSHEHFNWTGISLPMPSQTEFDSYHVVVAPPVPNPTGIVTDMVPAAGCTGSAANPVSAPGFVCIYPLIATNSVELMGWGANCACGNPQTQGDGTKYGFMVQVFATGAIDNTGSGPMTPATVSGVWVYTAP